MQDRGSSLKLATVVGARPQFIKAAVLSRELARHPQCAERLIHTGQHYDYEMSRIFFDGLQMRDPDEYLAVGSGSHGHQTAEMLRALETTLSAARPDCVLVFGDTNSTLAGALAAAKLGLPVAHIEAGLRSFDRQMPEEINRVVADHLAAVHFAPNANAAAQLAHEGIQGGVHVVGDLMVDLVVQTAAALPARASVLDQLRVESGEYALATVHRAANTDDPAAFARILSAFRRLPFPIVFPVHPRGRPFLSQHAVRADDNVLLIAPQSYANMISLERHARVILTDSGGIQKEAFALGVPCVTLRDTTEWSETLADDWNVLAGSDPDVIMRAATRQRPRGMAPGYPDAGHCAERIFRILFAQFGAGASAA
jgi:UDP-GlcNAc3NAcA epimerase